MKIKRKPRIFIAEDLVISDWNDIHDYFETLLYEEIGSLTEYKLWLKKNSELEAVLEEDLAWRYINMTIDTTNEEAAAHYKTFITDINPKISKYTNRINMKLVSSPYRKELRDEGEKIYLKKVRTALELFQEENIPLQSAAQTISQEYGAIMAAQLITYKGEEITAQQAAKLLKNPDGEVRKEVYDLLYLRRNQDNKKLEDIFDQLVTLRHKIAVNAGFDNYRDYKFKALNRFDYTVQDCFDFHQSIEDHIVPIHKKLQEEKLAQFGFDKFKPYDSSVDPEGKEPLKPFETGEELLSKTIKIFDQIDPYFSHCLNTMQNLGHLDLESKIGKAAGGYNYPLFEMGIPFIFMNAVGSARDVITMIHEGGHAVHSFLTKDLELTAYKSFPSEVAELASMSMELLSMKYWKEFYGKEIEFKRAKKEHLESILMVLPWVATIDAFQHWIYKNPAHTQAERKNKWNALSKRFGVGLTDWTGYENARDYAWHKQLHLFEAPFYYIEYGFSQLGALGVWKNSLENEQAAIDKYKGGLSLGSTKDIKHIYTETGVKFDFSGNYVRELSTVIVDQLENI